MEGTIKNLATVTKLDLTGDKDRGELLVDFGPWGPWGRAKLKP